MTPPPTTTTTTIPPATVPPASPSALAVFHGLFDAIYDVMDFFLALLRRRSIPQTCHAFTLAATCLYRLVRIELTLRLAPERATSAELARLHRMKRQLAYLSSQASACCRLAHP